MLKQRTWGYYLLSKYSLFWCPLPALKVCRFVVETPSIYIVHNQNAYLDSDNKACLFFWSEENYLKASSVMRPYFVRYNIHPGIASSSILKVRLAAFITIFFALSIIFYRVRMLTCRVLFFIDSKKVCFLKSDEIVISFLVCSSIHSVMLQMRLIVHRASFSFCQYSYQQWVLGTRICSCLCCTALSLSLVSSL